MKIALLLSLACFVGAASEPKFSTISGGNGAVHWNKPTVPYSFSDDVPKFARDSYAAAFTQWGKALRGAVKFEEQQSDYGIHVVWGQGNPDKSPSIAYVSSGNSVLNRVDLYVDSGDYTFHAGTPYEVKGNDLPIDCLAMKTVGNALGLSEFDPAAPGRVGPADDKPCMSADLGVWSTYLHADDIVGLLSIYAPVYGIRPSDYQSMIIAYLNVGVQFETPITFKAPKKLKGIATTAIKSGANLLYFDSDENFIGQLHGNRLEDRTSGVARTSIRWESCAE